MPSRRDCLLAALPCKVAAAPPNEALRFSVGESWGPPYVERVGARIDGGLLIELMGALAEQLDLRPQFRLLASARVDEALDGGEVDLHCLLARDWAPQVQDEARWSVPLLQLRDVLVAAPHGPASEREVDAGGPWMLSTVHNYRYPTLDGDFARGHLRRDNALNQWAVLGKLARGRTPLGVVNELTLAAYLRRQPDAGLRALRVVQEVAAHCLFAPRPRVPLERLAEAARRLVRSGRLERLLRPYALKPARP